MTNARYEPADVALIPKDACHVFVSRRFEDGEVIGPSIRKQLAAYGNGKLTFCDMQSFMHGDDYREKIDEHLERANVLLLVFTKPARNDFDWSIFEAGTFKGMARTTKRRTVCLHPEGEDPPEALKNLNSVPAIEERVAKLLLDLFRETTFTNTKKPVNPLFDQSDADRISKVICSKMKGISGESATDFKYVNPYIQLMIDGPIEDPENDQELCKLIDEAKVFSDDKSMNFLFCVGKLKARKTNWTWRELEPKTNLDSDKAGFNAQWMREVEMIIKRYIQSIPTDPQVESGYLLNRDAFKRVMQPEVQKIRSYESGRIKLDITFSHRLDQSPTAYVLHRMPGAGLAANIVIGSRIRHDVIEKSVQLLEEWEYEPETTASRLAKLKRQINAVQRDGFFVKILTSDSIRDDFEEEDRIALRDLETNFKEQISGSLEHALTDKNVNELRDALDNWDVNNANFLKIALRRYAEIYVDSRSTIKTST